MNKSRWDIIQGITSIILAICALIGIWMALQQSRETSKALLAAEEAFRSYSFPYVKFDHYQWFSRGERSCEQPATGINVYYRNVSQSPVVIEKSDLKLWMGEKRIMKDGPEQTIGKMGEQILAPNDSMALGVKGKEFPEIYRRIGQREPTLNVELVLQYRSIVTGKRYDYSQRIIVMDDCRAPSQTHYSSAQTEFKEVID
jgi:hypothetical protein